MINYIPFASQVTYLDKHSNAKTALILDLISSIRNISQIEPMVDLYEDRMFYEITLSNGFIIETQHSFDVYKLDFENFILFRDDFYYEVLQLVGEHLNVQNNS